MAHPGKGCRSLLALPVGLDASGERATMELIGHRRASGSSLVERAGVRRRCPPAEPGRVRPGSGWGPGAFTWLLHGFDGLRVGPCREDPRHPAAGRDAGGQLHGGADQEHRPPSGSSMVERAGVPSYQMCFFVELEPRTLGAP